MHHAFERLDSDCDGKVTQSEWMASRERLFERLDANGDGIVTAEERDSARARLERLCRTMQSRVQALFSQADANGDVRLSRDELMHAPRPMMERADSDHDGTLTRAELDRV